MSGKPRGAASVAPHRVPRGGAHVVQTAATGGGSAIGLRRLPGHARGVADAAPAVAAHELYASATPQARQRWRAFFVSEGSIT